MEIKLTESEINLFLEKFVPRKTKIKFTGVNTLEASAEIVLGIRKKFDLSIDDFSEDTIILGYELNAIYNQLLKWFVKLNRKELKLDKENQQIHLNPMILLKSEIPNFPGDFLIKNFTIQNGFLHIELKIMIT